MSDYELLPCPHCDGIAETNVYGATGEWTVKCPCGAEMNRRVYTEAEAIEAWNTRAQTVFGMTFDEVLQMIKRDAERERTCRTIPVKNGWDYDDGCSNCGEYFPWERLKNPVSFCPNCGAKVVM